MFDDPEKSGRDGQKVNVLRNVEGQLPDPSLTAAAVEGEPARQSLLVGLVFFALIIAIQWWVGAYRSEQGIYSDDAAHFMNGLLIRDYVAEGFGQHPLTFGKEYYHSYPKIAPGMWPPLFHVSLGVFLLPHWPPQAAALVFLALIGGWAAWRLYRIISLYASRASAFMLGLLFLSTPIVVALTTSIMVDVLVAALAIEAVFWLAKFMRSEHWRHAALFGLFTALACLTKGNGISLVIAPIAAILLTGRFGVLRRSGLYISALIVVALAVPALLITYQLDAAIGDFGPVPFEMVRARLAFYCTQLWIHVGPSASVLAMIGLVAAVQRGRRWQEDSPLPIAQALAALLIGVFVFHLLNPHQLASLRYMTMAIAPIYGLVAFGLIATGRFIAGKRRDRIHAALLGVVAVTTFFARPDLVQRRPFGYHELVNDLQSREGLAGKRVMVVSDEAGEGAIVADVAVRRLDPRPIIVRGSKLLGTDNWNGFNFTMRFTTSQAIVQELEDLHVAYVVLDSNPGAMRLPYWPLVKQLVEADDGRIQLEFQNTVDARKGPTRPLAVYRLRYRSPGEPKPLKIEFSRTVQDLLKR
jgi:Dolichyl-phosphate-mannose-protein mannosyltransferase